MNERRPLTRAGVIEMAEAIMIIESVLGEESEKILDLFLGSWLSSQDVDRIMEEITNETLGSE
jgi:hypothetical protein